MAESSSGLIDNHRRDGWLAVAVLSTVLETVFFALRTGSRWPLRVNWAADDYLALFAFLAVIAINGLGIAIAADTRIGLPTSQVESSDPNDIILFFKLQLPLAIAYICATIFPRMSIVAVYIRSIASKSFRKTCWIVQTILFLSFVAFLVSTLATCTPFRANWSFRLQPGEHCLNVNKQRGALSCLNVLTDAALIILPLPFLWKMQSSRAGMLATFLVFCLGLAGLAFALTLSIAILSGFTESDTLSTAVRTGIFATLEPTVYFIVACMITFRQLPCLAPRGREIKLWKLQLSAMPIIDAPDLDSSSGKRSKSVATDANIGRDTFEAVDDSATRSSGIDRMDARTAITPRENVEDEEASVMRTVPSSTASTEMDLNAAAEQLSRAHNQETFTGTTVISAAATKKVSTKSRKATDGLELEKTESLGQSPEVLGSKAIAVKHEFDVTTT